MLKFNFDFLKRISQEEKLLNIPNVLTLFRLLCVPVIVYAMLNSFWGVAFWTIIVASLTDVADGYIARNFNQQTFLGACLDPVADKVLVLSVYFTLAFAQSPLFTIPLWFVLLLLLKELVLIFGAIFIYTKKGGLEVRPSILGKLTMFVQVIFIFWLFACYFFEWVPVKTYYAMLGTVLVLVLSALYQYLMVGVKQFLSK